jgi:transposase InsO family protein
VPAAPEVEPALPPRARRHDGGKNKRYFGDEWVNYQTGSSSTGSTQKICAGVLDRQFTQSLDWNKTLEQIKSKDWAYFIGQMDVYIDYIDNTVEWVHPHSLPAKANA